MGIFGNLFSKKYIAEVALKRELENSGIPPGAYPDEVLRHVCEYCVHTARNAAAFEKAAGNGSAFSGSAALQAQVSYAAQMIGKLAHGDITAEVLQQRSPALFDALSSGLGDGVARSQAVEREV